MARKAPSEAAQAVMAVANNAQIAALQSAVVFYKRGRRSDPEDMAFRKEVLEKCLKQTRKQGVAQAAIDEVMGGIKL